MDRAERAIEQLEQENGGMESAQLQSTPCCQLDVVAARRASCPSARDSESATGGRAFATSSSSISAGLQKRMDTLQARTSGNAAMMRGDEPSVPMHSSLLGETGSM